jgi:hypothetical protein
VLRRRQVPPVLLARATGLLMSGRVHYPKDSVRRVVREHDDDYVIFRKVVLHRSGSKPKTQSAVLRVRFHFARHSARTNRILSGAVVPFIVAQPGFRSKTWMLGQKTGAFQGVYVWDSIDAAEYYWTSFSYEANAVASC